MVDVNTLSIDVDSVTNLLETATSLTYDITSSKREVEKLDRKIEEEADAYNKFSQEHDVKVRASALIASVTDYNTRMLLDGITRLINRTLAILFKEDKREVRIEKSMYRDVYPHYNVILRVGDGVERDFSMSGSGLGQVVSFMFLLSFIEARDGRKLFIADELLGGLHPDAKALIKELLLALSSRFYFIFVEYGMDIGKEYLLRKTGAVSTASVYNGNYYADLARGVLKDIDGDVKYECEKAE